MFQGHHFAATRGRIKTVENLQSFDQFEQVAFKTRPEIFVPDQASNIIEAAHSCSVLYFPCDRSPDS